MKFWFAVNQLCIVELYVNVARQIICFLENILLKLTRRQKCLVYGV